MRWIAAPLIAVMFLGASGFLHSLEDATEASLEMARGSEEAPATTAEAARGVGPLPEVAALTAQQASALTALADALDGSAERITGLNGRLEDQAASLAMLEAHLRDIGPLIGCVGERLNALIAASDGVPSSIEALAATITDLMDAQRKSIRHMKSINRKLAALGVVATASGVEPPPPPPDAGDLEEPGAPDEGAGC